SSGLGGRFIVRSYFEVLVGNGKFFGFWFSDLVWHKYKSRSELLKHNIWTFCRRKGTELILTLPLLTNNVCT
ncbi:MAG: hypothetical protein JSV01_02470, partial [Desulfobacterales bacterium]